MRVAPLSILPSRVTPESGSTGVTLTAMLGPPSGPAMCGSVLEVHFHDQVRSGERYQMKMTVWVSLAALLAACASDDGAAAGSDATGSGEDTLLADDGGQTGEGDSAEPDATGGDSGGGDAGSVGDGGGDGSGADTTADTAEGDDGSHGSDGSNPDAEEAKTPEIVSLKAQGAGPKGLDLRIRILGSDPDGDTIAARVRVLDASGGGVLAFGAPVDEEFDGSLTVIALPADTGKPPGIDAVLKLAGLLGTYPAIAGVEVALQDAAGNVSEVATAEVTVQPVKALGEPCDPAKELDRCEYGYGCGGTPPTCQEGKAPAITKLAYLTFPEGAKILVQGTEPEDDLATIDLDFLDKAGKPVTIDLDNDGVPDASTFTVDAHGAAIDGAFVVVVQTAETFQALVAKVAATPADDHGHVGKTVTAAQAKPPVKAPGAVCSPDGFDVCKEGSHCAPKAGTTAWTCQSTSALRKAACEGAPVIEMGASVSGVASGASLWDAPVGCQGTDPTARPEGLVRLHLETPLASLTLSTVHPGTNFDTVVYVFEGCGEAPAAAPLACGDDSPEGGASLVTLEDLASGDYLIVIDSFDSAGGSFVLSATAP